MTRNKYPTDSTIIGLCGHCSGVIYKRHLRTTLTCRCLLDGKSVFLNTSGSAQAKVSNLNLKLPSGVSIAK